MGKIKKREHYVITYPNGDSIEVSEEIYRIWSKSVVKERNLHRQYYTHLTLEDAHIVTKKSRLVSIEEHELINSLADSFENHVDIVMERQTQLKLFYDIIESLPEYLRCIIVPYYFQDLTEPEIAKYLGIAQSTVSRRKDRGLGWIRKYCEEHGLTREDFYLL